MRIVAQVVSSASISVAGERIAAIGTGLLLLVGFTAGDDEATLAKMADKVVKLRVFPDENGKTNRDLAAVGGAILSISQFTLYGDAWSGNRPSFARAAKPEAARLAFARWNELLRERFPRVQTGVFQANMAVSLVNEGPFTLWLDSADRGGEN